jgi:hypothetical protein
LVFLTKVSVSAINPFFDGMSVGQHVEIPSQVPSICRYVMIPTEMISDKEKPALAIAKAGLEEL